MTRRTIELIAFVVALLLAALAFRAWLSSHDEQQRLQTTLAAQKQLLDAADAREHNRIATLNDTLGQIGKLKSTIQAPDEILSRLQDYLSLPQPIRLAAPPAEARTSVQSQQKIRAMLRSDSSSANQSPRAAMSAVRQGIAAPANSPPSVDTSPAAPDKLSASTEPTNMSTAPSAQIPTADLKPLFNYVLDCRACQAQLTVAKQNSADDAAKIAALTRERDAAINASKGGTLWYRLRRNSFWLALGAGVGYAAVKR